MAKETIPEQTEKAFFSSCADRFKVTASINQLGTRYITTLSAPCNRDLCEQAVIAWYQKRGADGQARVRVVSSDKSGANVGECKFGLYVPKIDSTAPVPQAGASPELQILLNRLILTQESLDERISAMENHSQASPVPAPAPAMNALDLLRGLAELFQPLLSIGAPLLKGLLTPKEEPQIVKLLPLAQQLVNLGEKIGRLEALSEVMPSGTDGSDNGGLAGALLNMLQGKEGLGDLGKIVSLLTGQNKSSPESAVEEEMPVDDDGEEGVENVDNPS